MEKVILYLFLAAGLPILAAGQNLSLSYQHPDALFVCDSASFGLTVGNAGSLAASGIEIELDLPAGVFLQGNSLTNASISSADPLRLAIADLAPGASVGLSFRLEASCALVSAIDAGASFQNSYTLLVGGSPVSSVASDPYIIETGLVVITSVQPAAIAGSTGNTYTRTLTVQNTRPASLGAVRLDLAYPAGLFSSSFSAGSPLGESALLLGPADFAQIGNGDGLLDFNESLSLTHSFTLGCISSGTYTVAYTFSWGCGGTLCQSNTANTLVVHSIAPSQEQLVVIPQAGSDPACLWAAAPQSLLFVNTGNSPIDSLQADVWLTTLVPGSVAATYNGAAHEIAILDTSPGSPSFLLGSLAPGDSLLLSWMAQHEVVSNCWEDPPLSLWRYRYRYDRACPLGSYTESLPLGVPYNLAPAPLPLTNIAGPDTVSGGPYAFTATMLFPQYAGQNGQPYLRFELPCGYTWDDSNTLVSAEGIAPDSLVLAYDADSLLSVYALYPEQVLGTGLSVDFNLLFSCEAYYDCPVFCENTFLSSCDKACSVDFAPGIVLLMNYGLVLETCGGYTDTLSCRIHHEAQLDCPPVDVGCDSIPVAGYLDFSSTAQRVSYGLPDNDGDRFADNDGTLDFDLINRSRIMLGDVFELRHAARVVADLPGASFDSIYNSVLLITYVGVENNAINTPAGVPYLESSIRVLDSTAQASYACTGSLPHSATDDAAYLFAVSTPNLQALGCPLPDGFQFSQGDSLIIAHRFRLAHNLIEPQQELNLGQLKPMSIITELSFSHPEDSIYFSCGCDPNNLEVVGFTFRLTPGLFALPICSPSNFGGGSFLTAYTAEPDMFPYEVRPLGLLDTWRLGLDESLSIEEVQLNFAELQGGIGLSNNQVLSFGPEAEGWWAIDLQPALQGPVDEGFAAFLRYRFDKTCAPQGNFPLNIQALIAADSLVATVADTLFASRTAPSVLRTLSPELSAQVPLLPYASSAGEAEWVFTLQNTPTNVGVQQSGAAPNAWLRALPNQPTMGNFTLYKLPENTPLPQSNGIFQLGDLPPNSSTQYRLEAEHSSCGPVSVQLLFGWDCAAYLSPAAQPCYQRSSVLNSISELAELDMLVSSPQGGIELCAPSNYYTLQTFNADLGQAYAPQVLADLPPGLSIVPGSAQVAYPSGSAFVPLADPAALPSGLGWDLASLLPALADGLPGVGQAPLNSVSIRFRVISDCDYISGSTLFGRATAAQVCGSPSNTIRKPALPLHINGVTAPYTALITGGSLPAAACADSSPFAVQVIPQGSTGPADSLFVFLPPGLGYVPGSYSSQSSAAPSSGPMLGNFNGGQWLKWGLPPGLPAGSNVAFQIALAGADALPCGTNSILVQSVSPASAFCVATGQNCSILVSTGQAGLPFAVARGNLDLQGVELVLGAAQNNSTPAALAIALGNTGNLALDHVLVQIYEDSNANGLFDAPDLLLGDIEQDIFLAPGQNLLLQDTLNIPANSVPCRLLAVLPAADNCLCASEWAFVESQIIRAFPSVDLCSGDSLLLGSPAEAGHDYAWQNPAGCGTASQCWYAGQNTGGAALPLVLAQNETTAEGCQISNQFPLVLRPLPGIAQAAPSLCAGSQVLLSATDGGSYAWGGPGIAQPTAAQQWVSPDTSTWYSLSMTDAFGCQNLDSVWVAVLPLPLADAGPDTLYCDVSSLTLQAQASPGASLLWQPTAAFSDPTSASPQLLDFDAPVLLLQATGENGCQSIDVLELLFGQSPNLSLTGDTEICNGEQSTLAASGAATYFWPNSFGLDCDTCAVVSASPSSSTVYTVQGSSAEGCSATASLALSVTDEVFQSTDFITACADELVVVAGDTLLGAGLYCDTLVLADACDSLFCVQLTRIAPSADTLAIGICAGETYAFAGQALGSAGLYCQLFQNAFGCDSSVCVNLSVWPLPQGSVSADTTVFAGEGVPLLATGGVAYAWSPAAGLSCTDCPNPLATPGSSTTYSVLITNAFGCQQVLRSTVTVRNDCDPARLRLPNAITPNGDGLNDVFRVVNVDGALEQVRLLQVFNRWGELLFEGRGADAAWNGTQDGEPSPSDVYVYQLWITCPDGGEQYRKGDFSLLR